MNGGVLLVLEEVTGNGYLLLSNATNKTCYFGQILSAGKNLRAFF